MSRRRREEAPGQDSFLDVVANLVGILIILVMVVGLKTRDALVQAQSQVADRTVEAAVAGPQRAPDGAASPAVDELVANDPPVAADPPHGAARSLPPVDVDGARDKAQALETDIQALTAKLGVQQTEIAYRRKERDRFQMLVALAERNLAEKRRELDEKRKRELADREEMLRLQQQLDAVRREVSALDAATGPRRVIEHLPTPMARTVFGKELHFRLHSGRLAYLPMDELMQRFQADLRDRAARTSSSELHGSIGPLQGFRAAYLARRQSRQLELLVEFTPVTAQLGEPVTTALSGPSQFQNVVGSHSPKQTTVTIWTYPDSFEQFREVKQWLFQKGYLTACRPLPEGIPISASLNGSRSAAQ